MESFEKSAQGPQRLINSVGYELKRVQHDLRLGMDAALKKADVTTPQYAALSVLAEEPGISMPLSPGARSSRLRP